MRILARTLNNKVLKLSLSLTAYLNGPVIGAHEVDSNPFYLLESYLPVNYTIYGDSDLMRELEQACLLVISSQSKQASYVKPVEIHVDGNDLKDFKVLYYAAHAQSTTPA